MHDKQVMYRVQWPALCQHLHRLCLGQHKTVLLDALCHGCEPCEEHNVKTTVQAWQQAILDELAQYTHAPDAWPGWEALILFFGDTERLCRDIAQAAPAICHAYARGDTSIVWNSLEALQDLTNKDWQLDLTRCLEQLPAALRQAVEVQYALRPHPVCRTAEEYRQHYGCSARTLRDRATTAVQQLRQMLSL